LLAEHEGEMLCLNVGKHLGKCVGDHIISRAINEVNCPIIYDKLNKMIPYVNVLGSSVIRPVVSECDGSLRI
jgi:hypothetical protein